MTAPRFKVAFLEDAAEFINGLDEKAKEKVIYVITKAQYANDKEVFKKLRDEIWEFRILFDKKNYRLFAFWDKTELTQTMVISTHAIVKKTDKTPLKEIQKAENLRRKYFELKYSKK